jgi:NAD(P)-dependent dehydrogenase (short-subunit alcohol dehydrogenase family)
VQGKRFKEEDSRRKVQGERLEGKDSGARGKGERMAGRENGAGAPDDFAEQVVLVTGASRGIGRAVVGDLLSRGARVAACARGGGGLERLRSEESPTGERLLCTAGDVSRQADVEHLVGSCMERFGRVDGLVNNAGLYPVTSLMDLEEDEWDRVLGANLKGPYLATRAVAREMVALGRGGRIVNVSSTASRVARPGVAHYASSKAGLNMLTRVLAVELAPHGIRVNAVLPGLIDTEGVREVLVDEAARAEHRTKKARIPLGDQGRPEDVVEAVRYFLSPRSRYCTGTLLVVDGGYSLGIPSYTP